MLSVCSRLLFAFVLARSFAHRIADRYGFDAAAATLFGDDIDTLTSESNFAQNFDIAIKSSSDRFFRPLWKIIPYKSERLLRGARGKLHAYIDKLVDDRINDQSAQQREDFLSLSLRDADPATVNRAAVRDSCLNMLLASRDTTSHLLTWTVRELALNPELQDRLREEVLRVAKGEAIHYSMIKNESFPFLKALLYETLRLWPPVPMNKKQAVKDCVLPSGYKIAKGDVFTWSNYVLGRDEKYHVRADEYLPDRWLRPEDFKAQRDPTSSVPFASFHLGPRTCLGQRQALLQAHVVLIGLMRAGYHFSFTPEQRAFTLSDVPYIVSITLRSKPVLLQVTKSN